MAVHSIENPVGTMQVPLGVARNFVINGRRRPVLMATEEATVVAGASKAAKLCVSENGFGAVASRATFSAQVLYAPPYESEAPDVGARINAALKDIRLDTVAFVQKHSTHGREVWVTEPRFVHGTRRNSANDVIPRTLVVVEVTIADTESRWSGSAAWRSPSRRPSSTAVSTRAPAAPPPPRPRPPARPPARSRSPPRSPPGSGAPG